MKCAECLGACCETFSLPIVAALPEAIDVVQVDLNRWLALHATVGPKDLVFECKCTKLEAGRCSIYESRPVFCRTYRAGGVDCLIAVAKRRTRLDYLRIREPSDPAVNPYA